MFGTHNINGTTVHFMPHLSEEEIKIKEKIDEKNADFKKDPKKPMLSAKHIEGESELFDYLIMGNMAKVAHHCRMSSNRRYHSNACVSSFYALASALVTIPANLIRTAVTWKSEDLNHVFFATIVSVVSASRLVKEAVFSVIYDRAIKKREQKEREKNSNGNAAILAIDVQYDFVGRKPLKATNEEDAKNEANKLFKDYGITIDKLGLTVSKSDMGDNFELNGDFFTKDFNGKKEIYVYSRGSLAVANAAQIIPVASELLKREETGLVKVASQDWHPLNHGSFAANLGKPLFNPEKLFGRVQVAWPIHCVQGSKGAKFVHGLDEVFDCVIKKGYDQLVDSYSAFYDNAELNETLLDEFLQSQNIKRIYILGLATDYCVKFTALHARELPYASELHYKVTLVTDACASVGMPGSIADVVKIDQVEIGGENSVRTAPKKVCVKPTEKKIEEISNAILELVEIEIKPADNESSKTEKSTNESSVSSEENANEIESLENDIEEIISSCKDKEINDIIKEIEYCITGHGFRIRNGIEQALYEMKNAGVKFCESSKLPAQL